MSILNDPGLEALLDRLHAKSAAQNESLTSFFVQRMRDGDLDWRQFDAKTDQFMRDKFVALDRDKAELCYTLCRALGAKRVVEAGTSFGVSTLYLAAAVRDNTRADGGAGVVIGTEYEPEKAKIARAHFAESGLAPFIELREGDLRETLKSVDGPIDCMLIDIWTPMSRPALELVAPRLRRGAIVMCDNTRRFREPYKDYFEFVNDPKNELRTLTLPFEGGFELSVRV